MGIIILISAIIILVGLFLGFKYFTKTTLVIVVLIVSWLVRDYQHTRLPEKYDQLQGVKWFFDQKRNIVPEDQDQYPKLVKIINAYDAAINWPIDDSWSWAPKKKDHNSFDQFKDLKENYANITSKTWSLFEWFINQNISIILSFEEEIFKNTSISGLNSILSGWVWWDADPAKGVEYQIDQDIPHWSQWLIRDLTMLWSVYCYKYWLEQTGNEVSLYKSKCINYYNDANKITKHLHERKWSLILWLVSLNNTNNILQSLQLLGSWSYMQYLKPIIKENFSFLWDQDTKKMIQEYVINDYNVLYISAVREISEQMYSSWVNKWLGRWSNPYKWNYFFDNKKIIDWVQKKSINWWEYFYSFYRSWSVLEIERPALRWEYLDRWEYWHNVCMKWGVEIPCDETSSSYHLYQEMNIFAWELSSNGLSTIFDNLIIAFKDLSREEVPSHNYSNSPSRFILSVLWLDWWQYIINIVSANSAIQLIPRLTGYEKQVLKARDLYLEVIK